MLHENLRCYTRSIELAEGVCKEAARWPRGFGYLVDQLRRAMASVSLNVAEGNTRRSSVERRRFFEIARASAAEVAACIDLARAFGLVSGARALEFKSSVEAISKMLWALMR